MGSLRWNWYVVVLFEVKRAFSSVTILHYTKYISVIEPSSEQEKTRNAVSDPNRQVRDLGLSPHLLSTAKSSVAAQNRFIYYPDHLVRLPSSGTSILKRIGTIWREPLFDNAISNTLSEVTRPRRPDSLVDESIGSFISRRFGKDVADNIVSAVFHGIYAGDIYKLSAKTILPSLWYIEGRHGSLMRGMLDQMFGGLKPVSDEDFHTIRDHQNPLYGADQYLEEGARKSSVFTFKGGLGELGDRLEERLEEAPNVSLCKKAFVNGLKLNFQTEGSKVRSN